jgi:hypothetical protein
MFSVAYLLVRRLLGCLMVLAIRSLQNVAGSPGCNARITAVRRGGRVDAALGACRTDLRIMWQPLLVIRVSQPVSRAAGHR